MPRKASGDHTHFERFSAEHPESAKYLITNVPGQLVEIQAMANRGFREIDTQFRVAMTFEHLRSLGRTRAEAIRETGELFELKRSAVSDMVGAEPDDEDLRESSWDVIYTLLQGYLQDEIFAGTYIGAPKGEVTRMEKHASSGAYIHANCLLGRCLRCLVDDTPTGRKKLQARLATFQVQGCFGSA